MNIKRFDWFEHGVWVAHDPQGKMVEATLADTPYGTRAQLLRTITNNGRGQGYTIRGYTETARIDL